MENSSQNLQKDIWQKALEFIQNNTTPQIYEAWFKGTRQVSQDGDTIQIEVANKFSRDWLIDHYIDLIQTAIKNTTNDKVSVTFICPTQQEPLLDTKPDAGPAEAQEEPYIQLKRESITSPSLNSCALRLNQKYTFENFIVGPSNRFANAAALAVAESPAKAYNPLFIYGGVGLGKTHLMNAIGHFTLKRYPQSRVCYTTSENFTNDLINAIQHRTTLKFRQLYRTVDILLIDDIHFVAGKEATQEEFFHTFNALHDAHKQIVISSDRSPKDIPMLEERLVSRFEWGLVTDIQPPDLETRIAILRKKAEGEPVGVPDDVTYFIAERIRLNIRELEGALIRVIAYSTLTGQPITLKLAQEVLKDMLLESKNITIELIQKKVAEYFNIGLSDIKSKKRARTIVFPRQLAMYLARQLTEHSLPEIGEFFGGKDHTTVLHSCEKISGELELNQKMQNLVNKLTENIKKDG